MSTDMRVMVAAYIKDSDARARDEARAFADGYRAGYAAGNDVALGRARWVDEQRANALRRHVKGLGRIPLTELDRRRAEPGDAALAWRQRHGGEYQGGPVRWTP